MLKISSALLASFAVASQFGAPTPTANIPHRDGSYTRKRDGHLCAPGQKVNTIGTPRRKRAGRVSASGHHNHAAYLKRARKRRAKQEREVRYFIRQTAREYAKDSSEQL